MLKEVITDPIFCYSTPEEHATARAAQVLALHERAVLKGRTDTPVSEKYAERLAQDVLAHAVQIHDPAAGNRYLTGRR